MDKNRALQKVLMKIEQADALELGEIVKAVLRRYDCIAPDWEAVFLSLPKNDPKERQRLLALLMDFLMRHSPGVENG